MKYLKTFYENTSNLLPTVDEIIDMIELDSYSDLYPNCYYEYDEDDETMFNNKEELLEYVNNILDIFDSLPDDIPIYRALYAKTKEDIDFEYIGECWSFSKESALEFGSHNGSNWLMSGTINKMYVDWKATVKAYIIHSGGYSIEDENEITVDDVDMIKDICAIKIKKAT